MSLYLKVDTIISITFYYNVFLTLIHLTKKKNKHTTTANVRKESIFF